MWQVGISAGWYHVIDPYYQGLYAAWPFYFTTCRNLMTQPQSEVFACTLCVAEAS